MGARVGALLWFIIGGLIGFSALALVGVGAIAVLPALIIGALFLLFRIPGVAMSIVGAGSVMAVLCTLHITSGDTPDSDVWPIGLGVVLIASGLTIFFRAKRRTVADA